jgi:hypothetical protein
VAEIAETRGNWTKYCDIDAVLDAVAASQPDAVVAVFTLANQADLRLDGKWSSLERPEMRAALLDRMGDVAKATQVSGSVLLWSSVPRMTSAGGLFTMADGRVVAHNGVVDEFLRTHPEVVRFPLAEEYRTLTLLIRSGTVSISARRLRSAKQISGRCKESLMR